MQYTILSRIMFENRNLAIAAVVATVSIFGGYYFIRRSRKNQARWSPVAKVSKLLAHPIKSCRALTLDSYFACKQGLMIPGTNVGDRTFMVICSEGVANIKLFPKMVLIKAVPVGKERLRLEATDTESLEIEIPQVRSSQDGTRYEFKKGTFHGVDCGDKAARWLQQFLKNDTLRLVFHPRELPFTDFKKLMNYKNMRVYNKKPIPVAYQSGGHLNLLSEASLELLNTRLGRKVSERPFRTNMLISDCPAFEEDKWHHIKIGEAEFVFARYCTRCFIVTVDPDTGIPDTETQPLRELRKFRRCDLEEKPLYGSDPKFCVDFINIKEGKFAVGDTVYVNVASNQ